MLYSDIGDVDLRLYSGLDDRQLDLLASFDTPSISIAQLEYRNLTLLFLPEELDAILPFMEDLQKLIRGWQDVGIARYSAYNDFLDAMRVTSAAHNVINLAECLNIMARFVQANAILLQDGWLDQNEQVKHDGYVPVITVLGNDDIPAESARVLKRAVDKLVSDQLVPSDQRWRALEVLAQRYLNG